MKIEETSDKSLKDLGQYYGTTQYHNVMGTNVTDGVVYIMKNGYSWFVTDALAVLKTFEPVKEEPFCAVSLKVFKDKERKQAELHITDGNNKVLYEQKYEYTDAEKGLDLFYVDNVLMLSGEY